MRRCARKGVHSLPLPVCRALVSLPWLGLIASARVLAHDSCAELFTGSPGKRVDLIPGLTAQKQEAVEHARAILPCIPRGQYSIRRQCHVIKGEGIDFSGKRAALMAHWDPDSRLDPFVARYAEALRQAGFATVITSAAPLRATEADLAPFDAALYRACPGYDFTSWKGALECFPSLRGASEILFTNDSVFAPMADIQKVHAVMEGVACDFWGLMESRDQLPAMPSFYMVFREKALRHDCFAAFWDSVDTLSDKDAVVQRFEQSQALWFAMNGLVAGAYIHWDMLPGLKGGPAYVCWRQLIELFGVPCLKRSVANKEIWWVDASGWEKIAAASGYPVQLIHDFLKRYPRRQ